jgi:DNA repair protein RecO (recombination protein O)
MDFGDFDLIVTFFSLERGKIPLIAKSAKKSQKRFGGILELFCELDVVASTGRGRGLPVLQEAGLKSSFSGIRADITKTAYASYWAELIYNWMEEYQRQTQLYYLLKHVLSELDSGHVQQEVLSILFQVRFLNFTGHRPNLNHCLRCRTPLEQLEQNRVLFDIVKGGISCRKCAAGPSTGINLTKGTAKQLLWLEAGDLTKAFRIRFSAAAIKESLELLEAFVPYHLGKQPRSLKFLRQIRQEANAQ